MKPRFLTVMLKELKETSRDKRVLGLIAVFVFMYPIMLGYILKQQIDRATKPEREGIEMVVINEALAPNLMAQLKQKNVHVTPHEDMDEEAIGETLKQRKVAAVLRIHKKFAEDYQAMRPARVELWFDSASDNGSRQRDIEDVLAAYTSNIASARLLAHGVSPATLSPVTVQRYDTGGTAARSAVMIGAILGFMFLPAFLCGMSAAIDSTAGERERRSLEVLMAQPASTWQLLSGKWLAASSLAVVGVTLELMLAHGILSYLPLEEAGMSWRVSTLDLAWVCLVSAPLSLFAGALTIVLAMNAKSFKEAQTQASMIVLLPMLPGLAVSMMELKTATWMYMVPLLANQTLLKELTKGVETGVLPFVLTLFSSLLPALALMAFASWRMKSERYVLGV
jgi:sodium transport system permease protein